MTLRQAVHEFVSALELTGAQQAAASKQHVYLRDQLTQHLTLDPKFNTFLTGSYARSTAIRPLNDIDVFCVLLRQGAVDPDRMSPSAALRHIKRALEQIYDGKTAEPQNRSVNIDFSGTGIGYDVVPAFDNSSAAGEEFLIPDIRAGEWIRSNPRVHKERSVAANEGAGKELKPLTKAIKHWKNTLPKDQQLRSFHLEVMAADVLVSPPANRTDGLRELFSGLAQRIKRPTPDSAGLGPDLDEDLSVTEREPASERLQGAAQVVAEAIEAAKGGRRAHAHALMFELLGEPYPERGKRDTPVAPAVVTGAGTRGTDGGGSRFG